MDPFLIFASLFSALYLARVGLALGRPRSWRPLQVLAMAFFMVVLASLAWCDDLTTTASAVLSFDYQHATLQSWALLLVLIGSCSTVAYFGGAKFESVLENWIMDHVPGGVWVKTAVPFLLALGGAVILNVSTGLTLAASIPGAVIIAIKAMAVHASDSGTVSAKQLALDAGGGK